MKQQTRTFKVIRFLSSALFIAITKMIYIGVFIIVFLIQSADRQVIMSFSPCMGDPTTYLITNIILVVLILASVVLAFVSICARVPDLYLIRIEIFVETGIMALLAIIVVVLSATASKAGSVVAPMNVVIAVICSGFITAGIPAIRTFFHATHKDVNDLETWLQVAEKRVYFKVNIVV